MPVLVLVQQQYWHWRTTVCLKTLWMTAFDRAHYFLACLVWPRHAALALVGLVIAIAIAMIQTS